MDHEAGFLAGAASAGPDVLQCSLGTAWVGNSLQAALPPPPGGMNLVLPAPIERDGADSGSGERLILRVLPAGNATLDWAFATFAGRRGAASRRRAEEILARRLLPPPGLVGLPWLTRPNPLAEAGGCGGVLGADTHTGRDDLLRASVAGLCFAFRHVLEPVLAAGDIDPVLLTGGASQSAAVRSLLAALLHPRAVCYSPDADQTGTGGSVWAFNVSAARQETRPVAPPEGGMRAEVTATYESFTSACAALTAGPAGAAGSPLGAYRRSPNE
jgi:sugar (pentulose or hexulose) kinase